MGLTKFWRCDVCMADTQAADPTGWILKGRRVSASGRRGAYDLYLCSDKCAAAYFQNMHDRLKEN